MRFLSVSAATMVGMHVAGQVVRGGGIKLGKRLVSAADGKNWQTHLLKDFRDTQAVLDSLQGINRTKGTVNDVSGVLADIGDPTQDQVRTLKGFFFTRAEREKAAAEGLHAGPAWTVRDEIQQRLVKQARRLPYELPAGYVAQRALTDKIFGTEDQDRPNWYNPIDVIGDFAEQSVKNLATTILPFESGAAAGKQGWRRLLTYGDDGTHLTGMRANVRDVSVGLETSLKLVGHNAADIIQRGSEFSQKSAGAISNALTESVGRTKDARQAWNAAKNLDRNAKRGDYLDAMPGMFGAFRPFVKGLKEGWGKPLNTTRSSGGTTLERLTDDIARLGGGEDFKSGEFYDKAIKNEYLKLIEKGLVEIPGIDEKSAKNFLRSARISTLPYHGSGGSIEPRDLASFFRWGEKNIYEGGVGGKKGSFTDALLEEMRGAKGIKRPDVIAQNLHRVAFKADEAFLGRRALMDKTLELQWRKAQASATGKLPGLLGQDKLPYDQFGTNINSQAHEFLIRRSAQRAGLGLTNEHGKAISTSQLKNGLRERGLDPSNNYQMRAFLVDQGVISKPWNRSGFNLFGLRPLSAEDAIRSNYFGDDTPAVSEVLRGAHGNDYLDNAFRRTKIGGPVYETSTGGTVDFTSVTRGLRGAVDILANELQTPFLHIRPLNLLGYNISQKMRQRRQLEYVGGYSSQKGLGGGDIDGTDALFWMRTRGSKGTVSRVRQDGDTVDYAGSFRPLQTDRGSIGGRAARLAWGDKGNSPAQARRGWRKWFNVDEDQPNSLWRAAKRFKNRNIDDANTRVFAGRLNKNTVNFDTENLGDIARSTAGLNDAARMAGIPLSALSQLNKLYPDIFTKEALTTNPRELMDYAKKLLASEKAGLSNFQGTPRNNLDKALKSLIEKNVKEPFENFYNVAPQAHTSVAIHRRIDQFRQEIYQYMMIKQGIASEAMPGGTGGMNQTFSRMLGHLDEMASKGTISRRDLTEARAALFSTQLNYVGYTSFARGMSPQDTLIAQARSLVGSDRIATAGVLEDFAEGRGGAFGGYPRRYLGSASYEYQGGQYNPIGADMAFIPTFGTVWGRDPRAAVASVLGFNTWANAEAFSGASVPITHGFQRLNKYFSTFGLGLDETAYKGPLDMYARGMIGQRVLPMVALGTSAMMVDRQLGGLVKEDENGDPIYSPLVLGSLARVGVEAQALTAGLMPGGMSAAEKREQMLHGDVAVRQGRWWPLGNTPWRGGNEKYFRPSWYQRLQSGYQYTDQTYGSPAERLAFGFDWSPGKLLDPYHYERKHYADRPYPVTGDMFTGPWGPLTGALNATVGRVLKPRRMMHEEEMAMGMSNYAPVGEFGMAPVPAGGEGYGTWTGQFGTRDAQNARYEGAAGSRGQAANSTRRSLAVTNQRYQSAAGSSGQAANESRQMLATTNQMYMDAAGTPASGIAATRRRMRQGETPAGVVAAGTPLNPNAVLGSQFGYEMQELMGIYGFGFGAIRSSLGFGNQDMTPTAPVLESATNMYGMSRNFWDLNLGGMGDFPMPLDGENANLELSEITRRFIPRPRRMDTVNTIPNTLGAMHPWLPADDYFQNFHQGDPFAMLPEGEMRLPGKGYERLHGLHPDASGRYGAIDRLAILGDVAPFSAEYTAAVRQAQGEAQTPQELAEVEEILRRVQAVKQKHDFTPYKYKDDIGFSPRKIGEWLAHRDTYFHNKFMPNRTAVEDWERNNVYGATFPQWQNPIEDFLKPMVYTGTTRNPVVSALAIGTVGRMFGATPRAKQVGMLAGGAIGFAAGMFRGSEEMLTGDRFIPSRRRKEIAVEEYADILEYTKYRSLYSQAQAAGDMGMANQFKKQLKSTMYGADIYGQTAEELQYAIPKRKREHFMTMVQEQDPREQARILSTSGRLERRIYEAAWGKPVEERPDLGEYFEEHELPGPTWEGWSPSTDMENVKLKIMQQQGLDPAQMGYYPQQVKVANLVNPMYPTYTQGTQGDVHAQLEAMMRDQGIFGSVTKRRTPFGGTRVNLNAGTY